MWTRKVSLVPWTSSKMQTSPTFKLLSLTNAFHESLNLIAVFCLWIWYFAGQILPLNTWRLISLRFLCKSRWLLQNFIGKFCHWKEKQLFCSSTYVLQAKSLFQAYQTTVRTDVGSMHDGQEEWITRFERTCSIKSCNLVIHSLRFSCKITIPFKA